MLPAGTFFLLQIAIFSVTNGLQLENITCEAVPGPDVNSSLKCNEHRCKLQCSKNFIFPGGETVLNVTCNDDRSWSIQNYGKTFPECKIRPEECLGSFPKVSHTKKKCTTKNYVKTCEVSCIRGFHFPDRSRFADILCRNGQWVMEPSNFTECERVCEPLCKFWPSQRNKTAPQIQ